MRAQQRQAPKFSLGRDQYVHSALDSSHMGPGWIESKEKRVDRIYEALMGTTRDGKPSWTAIKENAERVQAQVAADREPHFPGGPSFIRPVGVVYNTWPWPVTQRITGAMDML
ncbi:hypothetical protein EDD17DRAFT_1894867 [Pisolithus thermaeus]|nr:hypothetical protein EDD17DRAFT_1894867 [Pisolithus thermaeus]